MQIIPGAIHGYVRIGSLDCSTDTGKIAASYGAEVCIFEPTPLIHTAATTHVSIQLVFFLFSNYNISLSHGLSLLRFYI